MSNSASIVYMLMNEIERLEARERQLSDVVRNLLAEVERLQKALEPERVKRDE